MSSDFYCDEVLSGRTVIEKVLETENVLAYRHTQPFWQTHIVVIPKRHIDSLLTVEPNDREIFHELLDVIRQVAADVTDKEGAAQVLTNLGTYQDSKHLHFHICSGEQIR